MSQKSKKKMKRKQRQRTDTDLWSQTRERLSRLLKHSQYIRIKTHKTKQEKHTISQNRQNILIDSEKPRLTPISSHILDIQ